MQTNETVLYAAKQIVDEFSIDDSDFVDIDKALLAKEFIVKECDLPENFASILDMSQKKPVLLLDKNLDDEQKRFAKAHALGHFVLERKNFDGIFADKKKSLETIILNQDENEICADRFAAAILAPKKILLQKLEQEKKSGKNDIDSLVAVASSFAVGLFVIIIAIALFSGDER